LWATDGAGPEAGGLSNVTDRSEICFPMKNHAGTPSPPVTRGHSPRFHLYYYCSSCRANFTPVFAISLPRFAPFLFWFSPFLYPDLRHKFLTNGAGE
jgi:hypothetical protein